MIHDIINSFTYYVVSSERHEPGADKPLVVGGSPNQRGVVAAASYD
ncbi:MAG: hypothetical protein ACYTXE_38300 [Nostoc sp.]